MFHLYLVSGAVFFATGVLLGFQARLPRVVPSRALLPRADAPAIARS